MTYSTNKSNSNSTNKSNNKSKNKSNKSKSNSTNKPNKKPNSKSNSKNKSNNKSKINTTKSKVNNNNRVNTTYDNINYEGGGIFDFISGFFGYEEEKPLTSNQLYFKKKYEDIEENKKIKSEATNQIQQNARKIEELMYKRNEYEFGTDEYVELTKQITIHVNIEYELLLKFQNASKELSILDHGGRDYGPSLPSNIGQISLNGYIDNANSPRDFSYRSRSLKRYLRNTTPKNEIEPPSNGPKNKALTNKRNRYNNNNNNNNTPRHKDKKNK
jgi:hypothetical protein